LKRKYHIAKKKVFALREENNILRSEIERLKQLVPPEKDHVESPDLLDLLRKDASSTEKHLPPGKFGSSKKKKA